MNRNSSFELLRIIAMFFIVVEHCLLATSLNSAVPLSSLDNVAWFINAFCICAVNIFFLLSGYYLKDKYKISRLVGLYIRMWIYSVIVYLVLYLTGYLDFDLTTLIKRALPMTFKGYWFMQVYFVLALLSPYIYKMSNGLDRKSYTTLIIILLIFFSIHQTFNQVNNTLDATQGYGVIWGFVLMTVGNYIKRYGEEMLSKINKCWFILGYLLISCLIFITNYLIVKYNIGQGVISRGKFYAYNNILVLVQSICLFFVFAKSKIKQNKTINYLAQNILSVYLIASQTDLLYLLWQNFIKVGNYTGNIVIYVLMIFVSSIVVTLVCIIIDKCISKLLGISKIENDIKLKYDISKD